MWVRIVRTFYLFRVMGPLLERRHSLPVPSLECAISHKRLSHFSCEQIETTEHSPQKRLGRASDSLGLLLHRAFMNWVHMQG